MLLKHLYETQTLTIDDLLTKEEQKELEEVIKQDKSIRAFDDKVSQRIRDMGLNVPKNIHVFLKFVHQLDVKHNPKKYEIPKIYDTAEDIKKSRDYHLKRRLEVGLDPYTGD